MPTRFAVRVSAAVIAALSLSAAGQARPRAQSEPAASPANQPLTITGCVVRGADYARATGTASDPVNSATPQLVLAVGGSAGEDAYSLTGTREPELNEHMGRRVEISGTIEEPPAAAAAGPAVPEGAGRVTDGRPPSGATGVTPGGSPAHEAGDAVAGTVPPAAAPRTSEAAGTADVSLATLPRLNVRSFRAVDGRCDDLRARVAASRTTEASATQADTAAPRPSAPSAPVPPQPVTVAGCLVRQTPAGTAVTADRPSDDDLLVLSGARVVTAGRSTPSSAVPGSAPDGSGSGTVADRSLPSGGEKDDAASQSFVVVAGAGEAALAQSVGQRVEITGTIDGSTDGSRPDDAARGADRVGTTGRVEQPADAAHPSAATQRLRLTAYRVIGGACQ